jgi:hypothetical protein
VVAAQVDSFLDRQQDISVPIAQVIQAIPGIRARLIKGQVAQPERKQPAFDAPAQAPRSGIITPENCYSLIMLEIQQTGFGGSVGFHCAMPVQVVGRDVQDRRHVRGAAHLVELEAGDFQDGQIVGLHLVHVVDQRVADVAANESGRGTGDRGRKVGSRSPVSGRHTGLCHLTDQRGCRGLSRRTGDTDRFAGGDFQEDLGVVRERNATSLGLAHDRQR